MPHKRVGSCGNGAIKIGPSMCSRPTDRAIWKAPSKSKGGPPCFHPWSAEKKSPRANAHIGELTAAARPTGLAPGGRRLWRPI